MPQTKKELDAWVNEATKLIRFDPDRRMVARELTAHLEDKLLDIQRIFPDMTEEIAAQRALEQMGDAEEVSRILAKIHRPWLGYLWRASQVFLVITILITLFWAKDPLWRVAPHSNWKEHLAYYQTWFPKDLPAETQWGPVCAIGVGAEPVLIGSYTITVPRASVVVFEEKTIHPNQFRFTLRIETSRPWELPDSDLGTWISVSDSAGYFWPGHRERGNYDGRANTTCGWERSGLTWREYEGYVTLNNVPTGYKPERPWEQTYTVCFNDGQTSFDIPIVWEEVSP